MLTNEILIALIACGLLCSLIALVGWAAWGWSGRVVKPLLVGGWAPLWLALPWGVMPINPWLLATLAGVLAMLAGWGGIYPHRPLVLLLIVPAFLSLGLIVLPGPWVAIALVTVDAGVALLAGADLLLLARPGSFAVARSVGLIASLGKPHQVEVTVTNRTGRRQPVWVKDAVPQEATAEPREFCVVLKPRSRSTLRYRLEPHRRGELNLDAVYLRVRSRLGFWQRQLREPCPSRVNVYPDMKQLGEYAVLARTNRLSLMGLRRTRRIGQDNEFERLRDYTVDDNYKHIDWRSTARRGKLTVKDFQANQSQRIIFLVDCGRMMTGESAGVSLLDHAFNATLMLALVALRQNDQVGLMCFSDRVHSFAPPKGGREQMNRLLHAAYNRFPTMVEPQYEDAFLHLASHVRKRSLVVLVTNVVDDVNAGQVRRHLQAINGRHLPLAVLLRDRALFDPVEAVEDHFDLPHTPAPAASAPPAGGALFDAGPTTVAPLIDDERLFHAAAAAEILTWRRHVLADLETSGVLLVDAFPENLTAPLVNRYLEVKARHLL